MMAGFREFAAGEPLTATNVDDFLMKQSVMKFADAAARDAALGTAVVSPNALREGMVAYLDDEDAPSFYDGSAWGPISVPIAGIGSNVVQATKLDTFTTSSGTYTDVTGLSVTITPSAVSSKILLLAAVNVSDVTAGSGNLRLTGGNATTFVGDAAGVRTRSFGSSDQDQGTDSQQVYTALFVDAPATASAITYKVQALCSDAGTLFINRSRSDIDRARSARTASSLIAIEVAA
jgi:hypothetical protein